jgi:hypothetical protein
VNPRSLFLFPTPYKFVYRLRDKLIDDLNHDITFSSAVNTALAYGLFAMRQPERLDREALKRVLREIDIFADEGDLDSRLEFIAKEMAREVEALLKGAGRGSRSG